VAAAVVVVEVVARLPRQRNCPRAPATAVAAAGAAVTA